MSRYTTGRDTTLTLTLANGVSFPLGKITSFTSKQDTKDQKVSPINGPIDHNIMYEGWSGVFEIARTDSAIDRYFSEAESNYYSGLPNLPSTLQETYTDANGTTTQFRYEGVYLMYEDAGAKKADQFVTQKIKFMAARRFAQ